MNGTFKKITALSVTVIILAFILPCVFVSADEGEELFYPRGDGFEAVGFVKDESERKPREDGEVKLMSAEECEDYLLERCLMHEKEIDIYGYEILISESENFWYNFVMKHPEIPLKTSFQYSYYEGEPYIADFYPQYLTANLAEDVAIRQVLESGVNELISRAADCDDPLGKLLIIHDEIIKDCEYDTTYSPASHNAMGFFNGQKMVCQGYAQLFNYICTRLGIEAGFCRSKELNHIWNYVCMNGNWYHVDVTWDDPVVYNSKHQIVHRTTARHSNFMVSDATAEYDALGDNDHGQKNTWISSLGFKPDCDDKYESRHIFNLPFDFTVENIDGLLRVSYTYNKTNIYLTSEAAYTGEIIASEIQKGSTYFTQYCYCLEDINTNINNIVLIKSGSGSFLSLSQKSEGAKSKGAVFMETFRTRNVPRNAEVSFMYWKKGTMTPLTAQKSINN